MEKIKLEVPNGIQYISEWKEYEIPRGDHFIVDKGVTGCGYTEFCLTNKDNIIRAEAVDWEVKQLTMNKYVSDGEIDDMLISEDDENNDADESNLQGGNDADEYDLN